MSESEQSESQDMEVSKAQERLEFAQAHLEALEASHHFTLTDSQQAQRVMSSEQSDESMYVDAEIMEQGILPEAETWDVPPEFKDKKDFAKLCYERGIPELEIPRGKVPRKNVAIFAAWAKTDDELRAVLNKYQHLKTPGVRTGFIDPYRASLRYTRAHNREKRRALLKSAKALERKAEKMKDPAYQERLRIKAEQRKEKNRDPRVKARRLEARRLQTQILQSLKKRFPSEFEAIKTNGVDAVEKIKVRRE